MRTQISTSVSTETRKLANELREQCNYSLRDIVTLGVAMLHNSKIREEVNTMFEKWDRVLIDGKWPGTVQRPGINKSLVRTAAPPESGCSAMDEWYSNERITVTARRSESMRGDEPSSIQPY